MEKSINLLVKQSIIKHWDLPALTDFEGDGHFLYSDVASTIARYHHTWRQYGFQPGTHIALCGRNSSEWCVSFLAAITYGAVIVPLLNEFTPEIVTRLINHAEVKMLIVGRHIWKDLDISKMPDLEVVLSDDTTPHEVFYDKEGAYQKAMLATDAFFAENHPLGIKPKDIQYFDRQPNDLLMINYTSGTTSDPKGVMIPERAMWSNMAFAKEVLPNLHSRMHVVSMLPTAHLYGMAFEFLYEFCIGVQVHFINRAPTPSIISNALQDIKPDLIVVVPMIIEKVVKKRIMPIYNSTRIKLLRKIPGISYIVKRQVCKRLYEALGGNFYEMIIGGSALNKDVEKILHDIRFPYTVGYGMTECSPIIAYSDWHTFVPNSCGRPTPRMEVKILSDDPENKPGEIVVRGMNVMLGYYKNEEATQRVIDEEGWLHTGDQGVMDKDQNIFIRGRIKNMLLSASGQNVYPEEIETMLNSIPLVAESVVVQRDHRLVALIYPDLVVSRTHKLESEEQITAEINKALVEVNSNFPTFARVNAIELVDKEFEKTPKKSIKRYMYS